MFGRKVNHLAGIFKANSKTPNQRVFWDFFASVLNFNIQFGVCPPARGMFRVTEADHANFVRCRRLLKKREAAISREIRLPEQSLRDLEGP